MHTTQPLEAVHHVHLPTYMALSLIVPNMFRSYLGAIL